MLVVFNLVNLHFILLKKVMPAIMFLVNLNYTRVHCVHLEYQAANKKCRSCVISKTANENATFAVKGLIKAARLEIFYAKYLTWPTLSMYRLENASK